MKLETSSLERIVGRISYIATSGDFKELGNTALEIVILRNNAEDTLEGDYSREEKEQAKIFLNNVRDLERKIAHLYAMNLLKREAARSTYPSSRKLFRSISATS